VSVKVGVDDGAEVGVWVAVLVGVFVLVGGTTVGVGVAGIRVGVGASAAEVLLLILDGVESVQPVKKRRMSRA